ncbi:hypothetical protein TNCV_348661 [Trichonephila clavipes]|nr:hypothetical protein TNCV_348661 [Trichonephila clavipes]
MYGAKSTSTVQGNLKTGLNTHLDTFAACESENACAIWVQKTSGNIYMRQNDRQPKTSVVQELGTDKSLSRDLKITEEQVQLYAGCLTRKTTISNG